MSNKHFRIDPNSIRRKSVNKTGFGDTISRDNYSEHGLELRSQIIRLEESLVKKKDFNTVGKVFFQLSTSPETSIKKQKQKIESLGLKVVSVYNSNVSRGIVSVRKLEFGKIKDKVEEYITSANNKYKSYFSPIDFITEISPQTKIKLGRGIVKEQLVSIVIDVYKNLDYSDKEKVRGEIINYLNEFGTSIKGRIFENGVLSIKCKINVRDIPNLANQFNSIESIIYNRSIVSRKSIYPSFSLSNVEISPVESQSTIGIIDSGITSANGIFSHVIKDHCEFLPEGSVGCEFKHGTFVASRCAFGEQIESQIDRGVLAPYCKIFDIRVFGIDENGEDILPDEFDLREALEDSVVNFHEDIRVYNLSLGLEQNTTDEEFTPLAQLLDYFSREYDLLFVIAAGNISTLLGSYPVEHFKNSSARIGPPGESLLSITVGSIAKTSNEEALANENELSPFSCIGPGADGGMKPELVADGGNLIAPYNRFPSIGVSGLSTDGESLYSDVGTSYSAPIIAQYAQRLIDEYPDATINTIKALLFHFTTKRHPFGIEESIDSTNYTGFGEPDVVNALVAHSYNATYLYEGEIENTNYLYVPFQVPECLNTRNKLSRLRIKVTIVMNPPVDGSNPKEYCLCRLSTRLHKSEADNNKSVLIGGKENYMKKWSPNIQFEKEFVRSYSEGTWELRLRLYTRGDLDENHNQKFTAIIEIIDVNEQADVYEEIANSGYSVY